MLRTRLAQVTWAILFTALVSSSFAQESYQLALDEPNDPDRLEVVHLLTLALQDDDTDKTHSKAMAKALEFIQRSHKNRLQRWQNVAPAWNTEMAWDNYANVADVHSYLADQLKPSAYWIGVQSEAAEQYTLNVNGNSVTGKGGLLVTTVTEKSPAEEAGLKVNDVILRFNDAETNELGQLVAAIKTNKESTAKLLLVRDEAIFTIAVTPRLREPQPESDSNWRQTELADAWVEIYGNVLPEGVDATVHFNSHGVKEIHFHQGDQTEGAKANELDQLSVAYRGFARAVVANLEQAIKTKDGEYYLEYSPKYYRWTPPVSNRILQKYWEYEIPKNQEPTGDRLERLEQQIKELTKAIHELKKD